MRRFFKTTAVLGALTLMACSSKTLERQVESEADKQPPRVFHGEVALKGFDSIEASKSLTQDQKLKLKELETRVAVETFKNQEDMSKLKGVLFETLTAPTYEPEKVEAIKKKLVELNEKKMKTMFQALDDFEKIIGYTQQKQEMLRSFMKTNTF